MSLPRLRLSKKTAPQSVNEKQSSLVRYQQYFINELSLLRNFCHKCQKPLFYTLCLLRHRSLPYFCTACFAFPCLRPFLIACCLPKSERTAKCRKNKWDCKKSLIKKSRMKVLDFLCTKIAETIAITLFQFGTRLYRRPKIKPIL